MMKITNKDSSVDRQDFALHPQCENNNISLRDYLAGLAMQSIIEKTRADDFLDEYIKERISRSSYKMADKMLEAKDADTRQ